MKMEEDKLYRFVKVSDVNFDLLADEKEYGFKYKSGTMCSISGRVLKHIDKHKIESILLESNNEPI
jgi:hypothetical protein